MSLQEVKIALCSLWYHHTYRWPSRALTVKQKFCASSWLITEINAKILLGYRDLNLGYFQQETRVLSNITVTRIEIYVLRRKLELSDSVRRAIVWFYRLIVNAIFGTTVLTYLGVILKVLLKSLSFLGCDDMPFLDCFMYLRNVLNYSPTVQYNNPEDFSLHTKKNELRLLFHETRCPSALLNAGYEVLFISPSEWKACDYIHLHITRCIFLHLEPMQSLFITAALFLSEKLLWMFWLGFNIWS